MEEVAHPISEAFRHLGFLTERAYTVKSSEGEGKDQCRISTWDMIVNPIILYGRMPNWLWNLGVAKNNSAF